MTPDSIYIDWIYLYIKWSLENVTTHKTLDMVFSVAKKYFLKKYCWMVVAHSFNYSTQHSGGRAR